MHIMLDLETLSTRSNAVVLSIGAVEFDPNGTGLGQTFYCTVDPDDQVALGRHISGKTALWWIQQSDKARGAFDSPLRLGEALSRFHSFCTVRVPAPDSGTKVEGMWGNGADFDCVILGSLFDDYVAAKGGNARPWSYGAHRCFRTLKNIELPKSYIKPPFLGEKHNALDDATYQALDCQARIKALGIKV